MRSGPGLIQKSALPAALVAAVLTLLLFLRSLSCDFVNLDDPYFVLTNLHIRRLDGNLVMWAFSNTNEFWIPLTWISFAVDYALWGLNPAGFHVTNILLHGMNTCLVVLIADRVINGSLPESAEGAQRSAHGTLPGVAGGLIRPVTLVLAGCLWGMHPLRVESVTWVTERKDVLNGLFTLLSVLCYLRYARRIKAPGRANGLARLEFGGALLFFCMSLLAKSISIVLPFVLLVADWYPLQRFKKHQARRVLLEKAPFLLLSTAVALMTLSIASHNKVMASGDTLSLVSRCLASGNALFEYVRRMVWPTGIMPLHVLPYPLPLDYSIKTAIVIMSTLVAIGTVRHTPVVLAVWLCFLIPLLPVLAFFQNGIQAFAARYSYLSSIVPAIAAATCLARLYRLGLKRKHTAATRAGIVVVVAVMVWYSCMTVRLIDVWRNTETLWSRVIELSPSGRSYKERGIYRYTVGDYPGAAADLTQSIRFAEQARVPFTYNLYAFRGAALRHLGRYREAVADLTQAISLYPHPAYYYQRALALGMLGATDQAALDMGRAGANSGALGWFEKPE